MRIGGQAGGTNKHASKQTNKKTGYSTNLLFSPTGEDSCKIGVNKPRPFPFPFFFKKASTKI